MADFSNLYDYIANNAANRSTYTDRMSHRGLVTGTTGGRAFSEGTNTSVMQGYETLMGLLKNDGNLDKRQMIRNQEDIARGGEAKQFGLQEQATMRGMGDSNLVDAIKGAIGAKTSQGILDEALKQNLSEEEYRRNNLKLLEELFINPNIQGQNINKQLYGINSAQSSAEDAQQRQEMMSTIGTIISLVALFCWVAREVLGPSNRDWLYCRDFILHMGPEELREAYGASGRDVAEYIKDKPELKAELLPFFQWAAEQSKAELGVANA